MAECYHRVGSKARGTRAQFRLNTQGLLPFKCSYPVHLTDVMDIGQSSQSSLLRGAEPNKETRTLTVREYEQTINELKKENFDLKLRIYLLEDSIKKYGQKDGTIPDKNNSVEVIVELEIETEALRKDLSCKTKNLEDALEQIEKLQQDYSQLQEQLAAVAELPSKEQLILLQDEKSFLQEEIENLQASLTAKNQELEEAACQIEELSSKNKYLEEKVKKSSIAIRGFISKHAKELELFPQAIRPIIQSAVESAKNNDYCNLDAAIKSFKCSLCEMMTVPMKAFISDSEDKENKDMNSQVMCLNEETFMSGRTIKYVERHRSDPSVQLNNLQEFKDFTREMDMRAEKCSQSLDLVHQEYTAREKVLSSNVTPCTGSISIELLENASSLISPHIAAERTVTTVNNFNSSRYSSSNSESAVQVETISLTPPSFAVQSCGTKDLCNISEHVRILKENEYLKSEVKLRSKVIQELNNVCNETEMKQLCLPQELKSALAKVKQLEITTLDGDKKEELKATLSKVKQLEISTSDRGIKEFKDSTKEIDERAEKSSQRLDLVHQEYISRGVILNNNSMSSTRSISIEQLNSAPSLTSPHIATERTVTTVNSFNSSHHSTSNSESAAQIKNVSVSPYYFTMESFGTNNQCNVSEHVSILKENEYLKSEVKLKSDVIQKLNNVCNETEMKQLYLQQELKAALSKVKELEITTSDGDKKVMSIVKPISTQTSTPEDQLMQFKESYKSVIDAAQSNNIDELKEEMLMLLLTIEEKEKNIYELKQTMESLEVELENALSKKELESDEDMNELRERLASSCSINNELMKHLLSLEAFMEDLLHQKNLDVSSLDNISGTSDFLSQLSKRLDESLKLSQVLSDHLSICEGSKVFGSEVSVCKDDDSMSDTKNYQHTDLSKLNLSKFDAKDEGRRNFVSSNQESLNKFAGTGKRWSYSSQYKSTLLGNSDNVVVLGTSNNEDLILLLNENGDPADVLIRNSNVGIGNCNVESNIVLENRDQHRRRCLVSESAVNFDWNNAASNYHGQNLNDMQIKALRQSHPWYGHYISSDSDIWSEPDRDISMQRIGIDVKSSPISTRSPRKLRFKDKRTTDDLGSDKNSSSVGAYKTQSLLRRRRSSGSASKRLFSKEASYRKDYKLEKHFSLLSEKISKFTMVSNQLEKIKDMKTEKSDLVNDIADELNGVVSSVNETLHKLTAIKENSKNCAPIICEKCSIVELLLDLERTRKRMHASDLLENINGTKIEHLTQTLLSEVDDLKRQLEDPHAILSSGAENSESNFVISDKVTQINELLSSEKFKNEKLLKHLNKLNDKCSFLDQELKEMQSKNVALNKDLENVNAKYNSEEQMFSDMKITYEALSKELENIKKEKEMLEKDLEIIQSERENLKLEFKKVESEKDLLGKQLQMQKDHIKFLDDQLQSRKDEYLLILDKKENIKSKKNFEREIEELKGQNELLLNQVTELNKKYDNAFKQLKELKNENKFLKNEFSLEKDYNTILEKQLEHSESKCVIAENEKGETDKKFAEEEKQLTEKNESLGRLKDVENRKTLLEEELKNLVDQLNSVKKQLIESNDKCVTIEKSKRNLEDQNKLVEEQLRNFKNQNDLLKEELQKEKDQRIMLKSELKKVEDIGLAIKEEKEKLEKKSGTILKQLEDSKNKNKSQEEDLFELKNKIEYFDKELNDMQVKNNLIEKEKAQVNEKIQALEKEKKHIEAKKKLISQELKDVQCTKNSLEKELEMYKAEKAELMKNLHETKEILSNEKSVISNLKMENYKLKNDVSNLNQEKSILNREKQDLAAESNRNILQLSEVNTRNNDLQSFIHQLELKNSETDKICTQLQAELLDTKEKLVKLDLKCSEYETQLTIESKNKNDYFSKLKTLENDLSDKKKCITVINLEKDDVLKHLENQKDKLIILEKEKEDLTVRLLEKEKEIDSLQKMHNELENEKFAFLEEKKIVDEKLMTLTASFCELKKDLKAKGDHVKTLESKCINYENEILSSSNIANNFIQKLETMKKELSSNIQVLNEIFGLDVTKTIPDMKKYSLDNLPVVCQAEMIDKLCYIITMENCEFYKSLVTSVQHLKDKCLTLEKNKAVEEQLKLELCSLQSKLEFLQSELAFVNKQKDEMKNVIDEHIKSICDKEKMLSLKDSEKHSLQLQLLGIKDEVEKEKHQWKQLNIHEMEKDQFKKYSEHSQAVIDALEENVLNKEKYLTNCDNEICSLKIKLVAFQNQIEKAESQLNVKDDEITRLQERIFNLQTQVNNLLAEKIDFDKQRAKNVKKVLIDAETSITDFSDFIKLHSNVSEKQTHVDFDESPVDPLKCDINSNESLSPKSQVENMEKLIKKINALQTKLSMAAKRIEILEEEKNHLRENLLTEVHARRKASLSTQGNVNEKILELETKLEKKASFIKELKNELYKTCDSLVKKQEEVDDLRQKIAVMDNLKSEIQFYRDFSPNSLSIEANIITLRKHKWELIQSIFDIQKKLYEKKGIHINHFQKFKNHIEHLHSLQVSPKLSKSESEPILDSQAVMTSKKLSLNGQKSLNCVLVGLEIDIECLENLKIFLKRFFVPLILPNNESVDQNAEETDHSISIIKSSSENGTGFDHVTKERNFEISESCPKCPALTSGEDKKTENCDTLPNLYYEWCKVAWTLSQKLDHVENIMKSLDSEYLHMKKLGFTLEGKSCVPVESLLQKMFLENKIILESTKIFHLNMSLKSSSIFSRNLAKVSSKQDLSDHESLLSEETITLSRSASLSPVSFEENLHVKVQPSDAVTSKRDETCKKSNSKEVLIDPYLSKLQTAGSSQDSVCQRSHYSSPDLGIESDPNHDSSAPEQMEKHELCKDAKVSKAEVKIRPKLVGRQLQKTMYTSTDSRWKNSDTETFFAGGETLHAVGILQEFELLKREVQESLVGIKSVLSRTGDGLHHIAKYTSPRKNLEYSTFRAIKDTCANIEVCLKEAYKLVNNFWIAPCPTSDEWNSLIQENQDKGNKIMMLKNSMQKQEEDFKIALNNLQEAQLVKEQMEKKIAKKLVKTKKILRRAEFKLLESECQNHLPLPNFPPESSHCQENH